MVGTEVEQAMPFASFKFRDSLDRAKVIDFAKPCHTSWTQGEMTAPGEVFDWSVADAGDVAAFCTDETQARAAAAVMKESRKFGAYSPPNEDAVYIIDGGDDRYKVGYSLDPSSRLYQLQTGCPQKLEIAGMVWSLKGEAAGFEHFFHDALRSRLRGRGEWFEGSLLEIGLIIGAVAKENDWQISDSEMYLRHRQMVRHVVRWEDGFKLPADDPLICAEEQKAA